MIQFIFDLFLYLVIFVNLYVFFALVSGHKDSLKEIVTIALIAIPLLYWLDLYNMVLDPLIMFLISVTRKTNFSIKKLFFMSFFAFTYIDLAVRMVGFIILPTFFNVALKDIKDTLWLFILAYLLVIPFQYLLSFLLHLDYKNIREAFDRNQTVLVKIFTVSMVLYYILTQGSSIFELNFSIYPTIMQQFRFVLVAIYFLFFLAILHQINNDSAKLIENEMMEEQELYLQNLMNYSQYIEGLTVDIVNFKEETYNALELFGQTMEKGDMVEIKNHFERLSSGRLAFFEKHRFDLDRLVNIKVPIIKSFLSAKLFEAQKKGVVIEIELPDIITNVPISLIDFFIIFSIFFDNAVEAAIETKKKKIQLVFFQYDDQLIMKITNSSQFEKVNIHQIFQEGYSTKGDNRGIGLANVMKILKRYPFCSLSTKSENYRVSQTLTMPLK